MSYFPKPVLVILTQRTLYDISVTLKKAVNYTILKSERSKGIREKGEGAGD